MKDNISIIFTAIIGTFLIVLLPLYSILDRQDSMSYNVVLTETTKFVDNIRNNGFVDKEAYYNYISALASTSNTYKVTLEAYRRKLIRQTDEYGNIIPDQYVEQIELYNTKDILEILEEENKQNIDNANIKNNVYLFNENDEIYVKVYNTNITAGSLIYNVIAGESNTKIINVSYGGIVNRVNWELYDRLQSETNQVPEVVMSVPVNGVNNTNIKKLTKNAILEDIDCSIENLDEYIGEVNIQELCGDEIYSLSGEDYTYLYDLAIEENRTIRVALELRRFDSINTGRNNDGEDIYTKIEQLDKSDFENSNSIRSSVESYIINNFIRLNGMYADIDLKLRQVGDYYVFDIILTNVRMSELDYISSFASITILPGLGQDKDNTLSLGNETVEIELTDATAVNAVTISMPHIWDKMIKTKNPTDARILDGTVYANEDIAFIISYTGINNQTDEDIIEAIRENLKIYINEAQYSNLELLTAKELNDNYGINIMTDSAGHVIVKFRYTEANNSRYNYIELLDGWIATNIEDVVDAEQNEELLLYANGSRSSEYAVLLDDLPPLEPSIELEGVVGDNGWFTSNVTLNLISSTSDTVRKSIVVEDDDGNKTVIQNEQLGGSGVYKNTVSVEGAITITEQETTKLNLETDGVSYAIGSAYDYVGNKVQTSKKQIKIDKTKPTTPKIVLYGDEGENGWYKSNVKIEITPGTDYISGVDRTTYTIEGANKLGETEGTAYTLTKEGTSTVIATTYDKAGNKTETKVDVYIDKTIPPDATITVIEGKKNSPDNEWYCSNVKLKINVDATDSISGLGTSSYRITGSSEVPTTKFTGAEKEIIIDTNGTHNVTVYTYTQAGNFKETKYTVKIDKDAPNAPSVSISGTNGENGWHTSNVVVNVQSNGDVGTSQEKIITYEITKDGITGNEIQIAGDGKINLNEEGEYLLKIYSRDTALNKVVVERAVKIDKTNPIPADFAITGNTGIDDWYISDVNISYTGGMDSISGVQSINLSHDQITENTIGTKVTLTTKDFAGHEVTKQVIIKLDKSVPTAPVIKFNVEPSGDGLFGTLLYNQDVSVTVIPGRDYFIEGIDNLYKTTFEITADSGNEVILAETEQTSFAITQEGIITITARTYDKAGNVTKASNVIWINKSKPQTPKIITINGINVEADARKEISGTSNKVNLEISKLTDGNIINIVIRNQETYEEIKITKTATESRFIEMEVPSKGEYSISLTQTNMFGTESEESQGLYIYKYE